MAFPFDFGSVPSTLAEDGDPLDVLVLGQAPSFPGCLTHVRLIGEIQAKPRTKGKWIRNERLVAVALTPVNHPRISSLNRAPGRDFRVTGNPGAREAKNTLARAERAFARRDR